MSDKVLGYVLSESEGVPTKPEIIKEGKGYLRIKTILQEGDRPNRNKRVYGSDKIERAMQAPYIQERLRTKSWYGESGHPMDQNIERQMSIDQTRISHIITEMGREKNMFKGIVETANTRVGRDMMGLIEQGSRVAFSFRGMAPVKNENGHVSVQDPVRMLTYDWVINPSHDKAFMESIMQESEIVARTESPEGYMLALTEGEARDLILMSDNVSAGCDALEIDTDTARIKLSEDGRHVDVFQGREMVRLFLEDYVRRQTQEFLIKL